MMIVIREAVRHLQIVDGSVRGVRVEEVTVSAVIRSDIVARWTPNLNLI